MWNMASTQAFNQGNSSLLFYLLLYQQKSINNSKANVGWYDNVPVIACIPIILVSFMTKKSKKLWYLRSCNQQLFGILRENDKMIQISKSGGPTRMRSKAEGVPPLCTCPRIVTRVSKPKHLTTSWENTTYRFQHNSANIVAIFILIPLMKNNPVNWNNGTLMYLMHVSIKLNGKLCSQ